MGTGVGEAMLIGAATGGGAAALTGGDPLKGALMGAAGGGLGAGVAGAQAGAASGASGGAAGASTAAGTAADLAAQSSAMGNIGAGQSFYGADLATKALTPAQVGAGQLTGQAGVQAASNPMFPKIAEFAAKYPMGLPAGLGAMGATVGGALNPQGGGMPSSKYKGPLTKFAYDPRKYKRQMAAGGLADTAVARRMMGGGQLGGYSDGGRLLQGPGDGMSDNIPANIGRKQPARLSDGEFVVPADVVSGLGNGSTNAGADTLYAMMDKVRDARTGTKKQGREIKAEKYLPT